MTSLPLRQNALGPLPFDEIFVADCETTGLWPYGVDEAGTSVSDKYGPDRLCSLAVVQMERLNGIWHIGRHKEWVCDPQRPIPERASAVNGFHWSADGDCPIDRCQLFGCTPVELVLEEMLAFVGSGPMAFHNSTFDGSVLDAELERDGRPPLGASVLCTKKAFSDIQGLGRPDKYVPGTNLNALCDFLGVDRNPRTGADGQEIHGALVDATLAAHCFAKLEPAGWMVAEDPETLQHRRFGLQLPAGWSKRATRSMRA